MLIVFRSISVLTLLIVNYYEDDGDPFSHAYEYDIVVDCLD